MENHDRLPKVFGKPAHPLDRFDLGHTRVRGGMIVRRGLTGGDQACFGFGDDCVGFSVHANKRPVGAGDLHCLQDCCV